MAQDSLSPCRFPLVSIIIVNYNGGDLLQDCLASIVRQDYPSFEVFLVDNASTDTSLYQVETRFPQVKLIRSEVNRGFAAGNNLAAEQVSGDFLAFLNPDAVAEPDWLSELVYYLLANPAAGLATSKILLLSNPDRINTCGNQIHFTGIPSCRGWMQPADSMNQVEEVCAVSGAAFLIRAEVFKEIGGFDESFFMYAEDTDLSWRARLIGARCFFIPASVAYHRYEPRFSPEKSYYLDRNRYQVLLKNFHRKTLLILLPALALSEVITWGFAIVSGREHLLAKLRVYKWLAQHYCDIIKTRQKIQNERCVQDDRILANCTHRLNYELASERWIARASRYIFDPIFWASYRIALRFCK
jgi:GT2 family glycosyltransferase